MIAISFVWGRAGQVAKARVTIVGQTRSAAKALLGEKLSADKGIHADPDNNPTKLGKEPQGSFGVEKGKG